MSLPKAQFKLPSNFRNIHKLDGYYYFGPYLAASDMSPIAFDRVAPAGTVNNTIPFTMNGTGCFLQNTNDTTRGSVSSIQSVFTDGQPVNPLFVSAQGATAGKTYVTTHNGLFCELLDTGELVEKTTVVSGVVQSSGSSDVMFIFDENANYFFVYYYSRYQSDTGAMDYTTTSNAYVNNTNRFVFGRIDKTTMAFTAISNISNVATGAAYAFGGGYPSHSKAAKYLGKMADGRHLFLHYPVARPGYFGHVSMGYMLFDPSSASGTLTYGANNGEDASTSVATTVRCVPTGIVPDAANPTDWGMWYQPWVDYSSNTVSIFKRLVPTTFGTLSAPPTRAVGGACTITGLPEGVTVMSPTTSVTSGRAQISTWTMTANGKTYLVTYGHTNELVANENSADTPHARHQLFVFEIDAVNGSNLIYKSHHEAAFGYSQQITGFVRALDFKTVVVANSRGFGILTWSDAVAGYLVSPWRDVPGLTRLHLDESNQIWAEDSAYSVFVFNPDVSSTVSVVFENNISTALYLGSAFSVNTVINVYNFVGERQARNIRVIARGCTFPDGSTSKDITTSATVDTIQSVIVSEAGSVSVDAYIL